VMSHDGVLVMKVCLFWVWRWSLGLDKSFTISEMTSSGIFKNLIQISTFCKTPK